MDDIRIRRRERRRRKALEKTGKEFEKNFENVELAKSQSGRKLVRRETFIVTHTRSDSNAKEEDLGSGEGSRNDSADSRNFTYSLSNGSDRNYTYNVETSEKRPVPAPRTRRAELEKPSSDTDRDVAEIDLDDLRSKSNESSHVEVNVPVPKPRKKSKKVTETGEKEIELPIVENLVEEAKKQSEPKTKEKKKKRLTSLVKFEKKKIPKMSSILKELKEKKEAKVEAEEGKVESQVESPHYVESAETGRIYVQKKKGFYVMEKKNFFTNGGQNVQSEQNLSTMENSTVKTAVLFQKFWTRSMTYFHGVLAGFGFSHAATITAIMLHYNYEPSGFINVYSCLSLKIHNVFYTLIALSVVSCFDRIDIGHMNKKHWENAWKVPSMWIILFVYVVAFALTFYNQMTEVKLDAFPEVNQTEIWPGQSPSEIQVNLLQWYHTVWTRDVLVLFAWLMISLTSFDDFLYSHINNMAKYAETQQGKAQHHRSDLY